MNRWTCLLAFTVACGGADQSTLLQDSGQQQQQPDGSVPVDSGAPDNTVVDAVADVPVIQDVVTVDVPVKPADSKIQCGTSTCSAQTQLCCYHVGNTTKQYECVSALSDCQGTNDVPVNCSNGDNCASQGNPGYICCAQTGGPPNPSLQCGNSTSAASVACQATCDIQQGEFEVGCSVQLQNCHDNNLTCALSACSLPGFDICR